MGVYSLSENNPIKVAGFAFENREFAGAAKYSDWKFVYNPASQQVPITQPLPQGTQPLPSSQPSPGTGIMQQSPVPQQPAPEVK